MRSLAFRQRVVIWILVMILSMLAGLTVGRANEEPTNKVYIPSMVANTQLQTIPVTVTGQIVNCETGEPYSGFPVRSGDVYYHSIIVLDLAFSPGAYTNSRGIFEMTFVPLASEQVLIMGWLDVFFYYYEWGPVYTSNLNGQQIDLGQLCVTIDNLVDQGNDPLELAPSLMRAPDILEGFQLEVR